MKIAYDPQTFCASTYGGVPRYFCEIASRIAKFPEAQVSIVAPMHINAYLARVPEPIVSGFPAPKTDHFRLPMRVMALLMGDVMLRAMAPDIVHETYFFPYRLGPKRARRVLTIYDMIHEKFPADFPHAGKTAQYKAQAAARADHVICISESTRRDAIEILGLPPDKTSVIYLASDLGKDAPISVRETTLSVQEPFLLYVGKRGGYKNFLRLLKAYATSAQLRASHKLVCFGGGAFDADELQTIQMSGLNHNQVMQLEGSDQLLARFYKRAGAFVYPSLYEGFGIPPLEAMAQDCPVVCSNTGSVPEVVGDAGEYFDPYDVDDMRAAIERVVGSDSRREALVAKGRARLNFFSWDRCAAETFDLYKRLV